MVDVRMDPDLDHHQEFHDVLAMGADFARFRNRQLLIWTARWILGLAIISLLYFFNRDWIWLWWIGAGFALIVPVAALMTTFLISRKIDQAGRALAELAEVEAELAEFEDERARLD